MRKDWPTPEKLIPAIQEILNHQPDGLSEYELLTQLGKFEPFFSNADSPGSHSIELFHRHFLLFHCLYRLEQQCLTSQSGLLSISALEIRLSPYQKNKQDEQAVSTPDAVREYYLDITQLESTNEDEVDEMLGKFWVALSRHDARGGALTLLGLSDPIDNHAIRKRYRELVMEHHPDRGGNLSIIQELNTAIAKLLPKSG